jgi:hypothetical protein
MLIPIEGKDNLFRDKNTGAIVNKDQTEYNNYIAARNRLASEKDRVDSLEQKVDDIKGDLDHIKSLLKALAQNGE